MMHIDDKEVIRIFKRGIEIFIDVTVKEHQEKLLEGVPDQVRAVSGFTESLSCHECSFSNLRPLHRSEKCSLRSCPCKLNKNGYKRSCPKSICDYMLEGIIEDHSNASPHLKTTDIGKWTEQYWEIALCYMKYRSKSVKDANLLDLLHLMANNKFIVAKLQRKNTNRTFKPRKTEGKCVVSTLLFECIETVQKQRVKSFAKIIELLSLIDDEHSNKALDKIKQVSEKRLFIENVAGPIPKCGQDTFTVDDIMQNSLHEYLQIIWGNKKHMFSDPLQISLEQDATASEDRCSTNRNVVSIFDDASRGCFFNVIPNEDDPHATRWSTKRSCLFSILEWHLSLLQTDDKVKTAGSKNPNIKPFSGLYVLSKKFAKLMTLQLKDLHEHVRTFVFPQKTNCLIIIDSIFAMDMFDKIFESSKGHTIVNFKSDFVKQNNAVKRLGFREITIKLNKVRGLTLASFTKMPITDKTLRRYLNNCGKKIGFENLKKITLEEIQLQDHSSVVELKDFKSVQSIILNKCNFVPVLEAEIFDEVEISNYFLSSIVDHLVVFTQQTLLNCPKFKTIRVHETHVGTKKFGFVLKRSAIESSLKYLNVSPVHCDISIAKYLVDIELSKVIAANCDLKDFNTIDDNNERLIFLNYLALSLKLNDDNLIDVYAAKHKDKCSQNSEIVFVCYMKDNFDLSKEHFKGDYKGFSTYFRSYDIVSPESANAEDSIPIEKWKEVDKQTLTNIGSVIKGCTESLMEKHSNLEAISISLGKVTKEIVDTNNGPCIVLFVRLKSFIPYNEEEFPAELCIPDCLDIKFTVDVREGFYTPVAENRFEHVPTGRLVMGCSIGCVGYEYSASLGPFVEWKSENGDHKNGFLTVCHVFCFPVDMPHYNTLPDVIQPASIDESDDFRDVRSGQPLQGNECGRVAAVEFNEAVDAAVVEITATHRLPKDGAFITCSSGQLKDAGLKSRPKYVNGSKVQPDQCVGKTVIKVGKETRMRAGQILHDSGVVRLTSRQLVTKCARTGRKTISPVMTNQIEVRGLDVTPAFCDLGDSGAGFFLVNADQSLSCVGILIGKLIDGSALVTPINQVLDKLSSKLQSQLCLKSFLTDTSTH